MTKPHVHPVLKSVRLWVNQGAQSLTWGVTYRTSQGREVFDRRVSAGYLPHRASLASPAAVVAVLEEVCEDLRARYGLPPAAGGPGAPGGGGGRYQPVTPGEASTVPLSVVRDKP